VVGGPTLRSALTDGPLVPEVALALIIAAAHAVGAIHAAGLVHRDLKPDNLVIDRDGAVIVIDLGLALGPEHSRHTAEDALTGSVPYMAPEQIDDRTPSPRRTCGRSGWCCSRRSAGGGRSSAGAAARRWRRSWPGARRG